MHHPAGRRPPRLRRPDDGALRRLRRRAGQEPRDHHRPDGQPAQPRRGRADGQAQRQHHHAARPGGGDRRRRRPLRAGAQLPGDQPRHRPRPLDQGPQREPGPLRAVRPRPDPLDPAQRRRPGAAARVPPRAAHPREGGRAAAGAGGVPAGGRGGDHAPRAAPGGALPRGHARRPTTASTTAAGCCRWATRSRPTCTGPGSPWLEATRTVFANGLALLGVSAPERM